MSEEKIKCPKCDFEFPLSEAMSRQIQEQMEKGMQAKEAELKKKEAEIEKRSEQIDELVSKRLKEKSAQIKELAKKEIAEENKIEMENLKNKDEENKRKIADAQSKELAALNKVQEMEDKTRELELANARKLNEERTRIYEKALKEAGEQHQLKDLEKDNIINGLKKSLEDAQRKATQGSMQIQGEVMELSLEEKLKQVFPMDNIMEVKKGAEGADVLHEVIDKGRSIGKIVWESKNTKNWNDKWIIKVKTDRQEAHAQEAVIVSKVMPDEIEKFGYMTGVNVMCYDLDLVVCVGHLLRKQLVEVFGANNAMIGKGGKMEEIYQYISGTEFRHRIEAIVETFIAMKAQLDKEKRSITGHWAEREKQIERLTRNTVSMYGDMKGIMQAALPIVETLELGPAKEAGGEGNKPEIDVAEKPIKKKIAELEE